MPTDCHSCRRKVPQTQNGLGSRGIPLAACTKCGCLSCGYHGTRTLKDLFLCIRCDPKLQAACAGANGYTIWERKQNAGDGLQDYPGAYQVAMALQETFTDHPQWRQLQVSSLQEWMNLRPEYGPWFDWLTTRVEHDMGRLEDSIQRRQMGRPDDRSIALYSFWYLSDSDARELLTASLILSRKLQLPRVGMDPVLGVVAEEFGYDLKQDFDPRTGPFVEMDDQA